MAMKITKVEVWAGDIQDQPGGLARVADALAAAGANIECCVARRQAERPGMGMVFVSPIKGKKAQDAARSIGMSPASMGTLRVEGPDKAGTGARIARAVADAGINMRGCSASTIGNKFVAYFGFDNAMDADRAAKAIKKVDAGKGKK